MKNKVLTVICLFLFTFGAVKANECKIVCPSQSMEIIEKESFLKKITAINFTSKKIVEMIIQKELNEELESKIDADLEIFTVSRLKKGEFKSLTLKSEHIGYRAFSMSNFYAQTICSFNKIKYQKKKLYYPQDLSFKYQGNITNDDIQNIINSDEFQKELNRVFKKFNNSFIELKQPKVYLADNKLHFIIPAQTFLGGFKIKVSSDIEVENNKLILKNLNFNSKSSKIISNDIFIPLIEVINPISYQLDSLNSKNYKIYITKAKISDTIINTEGVFIIKKNWEEDE